MSLMLQTFADVLTPAEHESLLAIADRTTFVSGLETASRRLADTKQNEQMMLADPANAEVSKIVGTAISRHSAFRTATMPRQVHSLRLSRYRAGMRYGKHVDAPLMQDGPLALRADLSFTLFLSDPKDYQGGELCLETGSGDARLKLPARHMVVYPTGQLHEVREVTAGQRVVVLGWIQSFVREHAAREMLWDLSVAMELVHAAEGKSRVYDLLMKSHANLVRRWAET